MLLTVFVRAGRPSTSIVGSVLTVASTMSEGLPPGSMRSLPEYMVAVAPWAPPQSVITVPLNPHSPRSTSVSRS